MRPDQGNPLDLNNLPDDHYSSRDHGKQQLLLDDAVSTGYRKKKSGGKEECGKVYECRFCSLKFCKSQALGGHMNRHRQERETETLNRARQLVFSNDNLAAQAHLSCCHPITPPPGSGYHHPPPPQPAGPDPTMPLRFPARMYSGNSASPGFIPPPPPPPPPPQQHPQPYMYASSVRPPPQPLSFSPHYQPPTEHYYVGHVLGGTNNTSALTSSSSHHPHNNNINYAAAAEPNYTCIGAPVGPTHMFGRGTTTADSGGRDGSLH